ncbi:MAG: leucyl/phenylalanyl-tRNA--protein transferase [Candidatus Cyclonatronum sp.]|uniref:leucyl/phenylalanyl-tRNA--protein transferase n=1 Tax=Cyclonatronum sp. TaxID=3024185 RepID=UPI0025C1D8BF|nr:leucyl/phenylalanyl-tRNA--protein transferase [Cyclonatronum sp.]MCH8487302.1 leucyl/phenylalanyl-tRNA--protein transferase [Cyclonatronum sp.]
MKQAEGPMLDIGQLLEAYSTGYFPMAEGSGPDAEIGYYSAWKRGIIPLDGFHMPKRALRHFKKSGFSMSLNQHFEGVLEGCANRPSTWINPVIHRTFLYLHYSGYAHSVEVLREGRLVGGLYGLALGGAFFAESVFQYEPEAHKAALWFCHGHLLNRGFSLWDAQYYTPHLGQFGCREIPAKRYDVLLQKALKLAVTFSDHGNPGKPTH